MLFSSVNVKRPSRRKKCMRKDEEKSKLQNDETCIHFAERGGGEEEA